VKGIPNREKKFLNTLLVNRVERSKLCLAIEEKKIWEEGKSGLHRHFNDYQSKCYGRSERF
jgi:hypothetical protein